MTEPILPWGGPWVLDPIVPVPLVILLALGIGALTVWTYQRTGERLSRPARLGLLCLRLLGIALVLLILLQPSRIEPVPTPQRDAVTVVAIDNSRSMRQADAGRRSRLDAARELVWGAGLVPRESGGTVRQDLRLFKFGTDAAPLTDTVTALTADDNSTRFHQSVQTLLGALGAHEAPRALFLLTDGHDFELANPSQTALLARQRQTPIYAVALGGEGTVRDLSVRFTSFQPFHYARQTIRLTAALRVLGCPYETLSVTLTREGRVVQTKTLPVREEAQVPVVFEVTEPGAGQFEYRIDVAPLPGEVTAENNRASVYCNVIDKKVRILVLEAEPYWDTTFLLRSLRRNTKLEVDSAIHYGKNKLSVLRTAESTEPFRLPKSAQDWNGYDIVFLGRSLHEALEPQGIQGLQAWVEHDGGALVFARGDAFGGTVDTALQPVRWGPMVPRPGPLRVGREGQGLPPLSLMGTPDSSAAALPPPIGMFESTERKPLTATLAITETRSEFPAMVHRRFGSGQVLAIGVDGLWRWAFNAQSDGRTTVYDRFWDQMVLWLMGGRDVMPATAFTFRADAGNVPLGEKIRFRVVPRDPTKLPAAVPIVLRHEGREVGRLDAARAPDGGRLVAEYLPERAGRYEAIADLPDRTRATVRFAVHADDAEETEVAADPGYLRKLCEASRGRLLRPDEFAATLQTVEKRPMTASPQTRKVSLWDTPAWYWLVGALLGADWFLRRRWGLC